MHCQSAPPHTITARLLCPMPSNAEGTTTMHLYTPGPKLTRPLSVAAPIQRVIRDQMSALSCHPEVDPQAVREGQL
eukprot:11075963-Alexandrium_andersonii.AAC.1